MTKAIPENRTLAQQLGRAFTTFGALVASGFFITGFTYARRPARTR